MPWLFTNFENTTLGLFHKNIISVIDSLLSSVSTFHFHFKLLLIPCWLYVYSFSKNNYMLKAYMFYGRCFMFPAFVATITSNLFWQFTIMILLEMDCLVLLVDPPLSDHQEAAQLCWSTFLSVLMCKYIFLHEPNDSIWKLPFDPISPIYKNKDCKIVLFTLTKRMFYLIRSRTSTYVVMQILLLMVVFRF